MVISNPVPCYHGEWDNTSVGRPLDGSDDGQAGGNYIATFSRSGMTLGKTEDRGPRTEEIRSPPARIEARVAATVFEIRFGRHLSVVFELSKSESLHRFHSGRNLLGSAATTSGVYRIPWSLRYGNICRSDFEPLGLAGYWVPELDRAAAGQLFREHNQIGAGDSRDSRGDQESLKAGKIEERGPQKLGRRLA